MKIADRNRYIAIIMVCIVILLAFWYWSSRIPTKTYNVSQVAWQPPTTTGGPFTLQYTLTTPADSQLVGGKSAILTNATPSVQSAQALIDILTQYPFTITPGSLSQDGLTLSIQTLPKIPSSVGGQVIALSSGQLKVTMK